MSRERFCGNMQWISLAGKLESFFFAVPYNINLVNEGCKGLLFSLATHLCKGFVHTLDN